MLILYAGFYDSELNVLTEQVREDSSSLREALTRILGAYIVHGGTTLRIAKYPQLKAAVAPLDGGRILAVCGANANTSDTFLTSFMTSMSSLHLPSASAASSSSGNLRMNPRPLENLVNQFSWEDLRASGLGELQTDLERLRSRAIENMKLLVDRG